MFAGYSTLLDAARKGFFIVSVPILLAKFSGAQLDFSQALELASRKSASMEIASVGEREAYSGYVEALSRYLPQIVVGPIVRPSPALVSSGIKDSSAFASPGGEHGRAILVCAIVYAELVKTDLQREVLVDEERFAAKLLTIQSWRTLAQVDDVATLSSAKLANVRTKKRIAELDAAKRLLTRNLVFLTNLSDEDIRTIPDSMPSFAALISDSGSIEPEVHRSEQAPLDDLQTLRDVIEESQFARDEAQLQYMLSRIDAQKAEVTAESGKSSIAAPQFANVAESESLDALLETNANLLVAQLEFLSLEGKLEEFRVTPDSAIKILRERVQSPVSSDVASEVKSILITPRMTDIASGESRQLAAFAISGNGSVKHSPVAWQSSNDWNCVVSTSGLVTAIRAGQATVTARAFGVSQSQRITISSKKR
jgi:Bacterial Ig-like domain (group 2)